MDRKGLEIVKFLLDWNYLLTEPPVNGSIPEIYFCFVCSVYSKGKDKVSWLQFIKYLRLINKLCNGNTLVCIPDNALNIPQEDIFRCFDKISYINRLSLALLLRTSQSLHYSYTPPSSSGSSVNDSTNNNNNNSNLDLSNRSLSVNKSESNNNEDEFNRPSSASSDSVISCQSSNSPSFVSMQLTNKENKINFNENNKDANNKDDNIIDNIELHYKRKTLEDVNYQIPTTKTEKLKYVLNLIEGEKPIVSENDIYPIKMINNKKLIPKDINDTYTLTAKSNRLEQLDYLLNNECSSHSLQRERARLRTIVLPFYECCEDNEHCTLLSSFISFDKNTSFCLLNKDKLNKMIYDNNDKINQRFYQLYKCCETKMHFIPIIQLQTDIKLGDCSYLDTCHKISTCRYIHYGQLMPLKKELFKEDKENNDEENNNKNNKEIKGDKNKINEEIKLKELYNIKENIRIWDFTRGETICNYLNCDLPAQWINCDLMKINFDVFGNDFGVVIADPSWTIHMNLNYSSLKDEELLSLRMDKLQKEGIFLLWVTGRTIETGRDFLNKWGYKVINQITWIKTSQLIRTISTGRTGHWLNHSKEHLLVGIKGECKWINKSIDSQIILSSTRETSRKPDEIYGIVDRLVGNGVRKLEIFGRQHNTRPGWLTVGNQLNGVNIIEKELRNRYERLCRSTLP